MLINMLDLAYVEVCTWTRRIVRVYSSLYFIEQVFQPAECAKYPQVWIISF